MEYIKSLNDPDWNYQRALNAWGSGTGSAFTTLKNLDLIKGERGGNFFRAAGGSVTAGSMYMVGERGPEMFVPSQSGSIIPNSGVIHVHVDVDGNEIGNAMVDLIRLRTGVRM